jgi:excisionase family DNA binding protein
MHAVAVMSGSEKSRVLSPEISLDSRVELRVDGALIDMPDQLKDLLVMTLSEFFSGKEVSVRSEVTFLTTQEAAEMIGVSRPTLIKLLEKYRTPISTSGSHRRIRLSDLFVLEDQLRSEQSKNLDELIHLSEELGLYDLTDKGYNPLAKS